MLAATSVTLRNEYQRNLRQENRCQENLRNGQRHAMEAFYWRPRSLRVRLPLLAISRPDSCRYLPTVPACALT